MPPRSIGILLCLILPVANAVDVSSSSSITSSSSSVLSSELSPVSLSISSSATSVAASISSSLSLTSTTTTTTTTESTSAESAAELASYNGISDQENSQRRSGSVLRKRQLLLEIPSPNRPMGTFLKQLWEETTIMDVFLDDGSTNQNHNKNHNKNHNFNHNYIDNDRRRIHKQHKEDGGMISKQAATSSSFVKSTSTINEDDVLFTSDMDDEKTTKTTNGYHKVTGMELPVFRFMEEELYSMSMSMSFGYL